LTIKCKKIHLSKRNLKPISCLCPNNVYFEFNSFKEAALHIGVRPQSIQTAVLDKIENISLGNP
jgi:hypothetical protein